MDARPIDGAGRRPLRPSWSYYPEQSIGGVPIPARRDHVPGIERRRRLQRHHAADGRSPTTCSATARPRSSSTWAGIWKRRSTATATTRRCCRRRACRQTVTRTWTDANGNFVPDCDLTNVNAQDLRSSGRLLRPDQPSELRQEQPARSPTTPDHAGLGRPAGRLADRRDPPARAAAARLDGSRLHAPVAPELHRHRQPRPDGGRLTRRSASRRRSIRGCRAAAATWSPASTTWCREERASDRQLPDLRAELREPSRRSTTAWIST